MIHVVTVHYKSDKWIDPQLSYLRRHLHEPYQLWGSLEGVEDRTSDFDHVVPSVGPHAGKLNLIATEIAARSDPHDLIMFLDGDAFPIADPMPTVRQALSRSDLVAVRRDENLNDVQPHPCFAVVTVGAWLELTGDWTAGYPWHNSEGQLVSDVGGNLLHLLELHDKTWTPLLRSNQFELHPVWYGIYGGIVYHHGAGFRPSRYTRHDDVQVKRRFSRLAEHPVVGWPVRHWNFRRAHGTRQRQSDDFFRQGEEIFRELQVNPEFYRRFLDGSSTPGQP